jgi:hypothetical protein
MTYDLSKQNETVKIKMVIAYYCHPFFLPSFPPFLAVLGIELRAPGFLGSAPLLLSHSSIFCSRFFFSLVTFEIWFHFYLGYPGM